MKFWLKISTLKFGPFRTSNDDRWRSGNLFRRKDAIYEGGKLLISSFLTRNFDFEIRCPFRSLTKRKTPCFRRNNCDLFLLREWARSIKFLFFSNVGRDEKYFLLLSSVFRPRFRFRKRNGEIERWKSDDKVDKYFFGNIFSFFPLTNVLLSRVVTHDDDRLFVLGMKNGFSCPPWR